MTSSGCRRRVLSVAAVVIAVTIGLLSPGGAAGDALPKSITKLLAEYRIPASAVSLEVREMGDNTPLLSLNAQTPRNPASVIKLLTTLAALELLGPGYQWETTYLAAGTIEDGVLDGDLILRGGGDPFVTVEQVLGHVLALRQTGLETITGDLVIDNSHFAVESHDRDAFDGKTERLYNIGPDAALTNFSATRFVIEPRGDRIRVTADPPLAGLKIDNRIKPRSGKCISRNAGWSYRLDRSGENPMVRFHGTYRTRCGTHSISRSILPNTEYTYRLFTALWRMMGGTMGDGGSGGYRVSPTPDSAQMLLTRPSEPLADIITGINKFSNNVMSRQLLLSVGAELSDQPGSVAAGASGIRDWLSANDIAMPELVLENGSGLSRNGRASAAGLSALLAHGWGGTYRPEFLSSLPLAAIDGTMRTRLNDSPLRARARIKTGAIRGVRSMAGYVHARNDRHYSVVLLLNSGKVTYHNGNAVQDAVLRWVYRR